jgi:signal transduction histidine kinase/ActR/RegA family two-component response regulator
VTIGVVAEARMMHYPETANVWSYTSSLDHGPRCAEALMPLLYDLSGDVPRVFELGTTTTIGRAPESSVHLTDSMVSLRHAEVRRTGEAEYRLIDLGSRYGTVVGGKRVTDVVLREGDEILVGAARLRFHAGSDASDPLGPLSDSMPLRRLSVREPSFRPASDILLQDDLAREYDRLRVALEVTRAIGGEHEPALLLERILDTVNRLFQAERAAILLLDAAGQPTAQLARLRTGANVKIPLSTRMLSEVMATRSGVVTADAESDTRFNRSASVHALRLRSAMCVPMLHRDELLGVMQLDSQLGDDSFTEKDLDLLLAVTGQVALAIKNATLMQQIQTVTHGEWQRLERVLEALPSGVILLDEERRLAMTNGRANELLPHLTRAAPGEIIETLGGVAVDALLAAGGPSSTDVVTAGPPRRIFALSASHATADVARSRETVVVIHEVTDEREREARENQQERLALIGQLAGGIAHDFNNLLGVILSYADFIGERVVEKEVLDDVGEVKEAALRAAELTKQLLAFSRRELITLRVFDLTQLVADMRRLMERAIGGAITLQTSSAARPIRVKADRSRLEQVLLNLVVNARDAMPGGGTLRVETQVVEIDAATAAPLGIVPGSYGVIAVHDTGGGMPPEVAARVFEPFFTTKERGKGTGLGLATAYGTVKQVGGHIAVESTLGVGTTFRMLLPATDDVEPITSGRRRSVVPAGRETVLLAEDEPAVRELTRRTLTSAGYVVIAAGNGAEALRVLDHHPGKIDLLLTDLVMPGLSGKQLAERVCARRPTIRVVYMSGYVDRQADDQGPDDDGRALVTKPFTRDDLLRAVRDALAGE